MTRVNVELEVHTMEGPMILTLARSVRQEEFAFINASILFVDAAEKTKGFALSPTHITVALAVPQN